MQKILMANQSIKMFKFNGSKKSKQLWQFELILTAFFIKNDNI